MGRTPRSGSLVFLLRVLGKTTPMYPLRALVALIGVVFVVFFWSRIATNLYLSTSGEPATAVVTRASEYIGNNIPGAMLYFTYEVNGKTLKAKQHVRSSAYREGEEVDVVYAPRYPALVGVRSEVTGSRQRRDAVVMGGIGLVLSAIGIPGLIRWVRRACALKTLAERGVSREGTVERVLERPYKLGSVTPLYLEYAFTGTDGQRRVSTSDDLPREAAADYKAGERLTVLQDPGNPETNAVDVWNILRDR
jgi:hypothetical protein